MQTNTPGSLKEKFGHFGAAPTEQLWNSISSSLDKKEKKRRGIFWWWFAGIAASGLLLFGIYHLGYQVGKNESNLAQKNIHSVSSDSENRFEPSDANSTGALPATENTAESTDNLVERSDVNSNVLQNNPSMTGSKEGHLENTADFNLNRALPAVKMHVSAEDDLARNTSEQMADFDHPEIHKIVLPHEGIFDAPVNSLDENISSTNKWELGFSFGTQMTTTKKEEPILVDLGNGFSLDYSNMENTIQGSGLLNSQSPTSGTISRPLSIDFSIARTLGKRWSLQSGLGINWIKSTTFYAYFMPSQVNASFFSLSVPMIAEFDFVKRKKFEFSAGVGVVNEIPFYLRSTSLYPMLESKTVSTSFIRGYMASGLINIGVSYRLSEKMKIGLHPNLRQYFFQSMKSDFPVVEKKTWIGANIGLVWEI